MDDPVQLHLPASDSSDRRRDPRGRPRRPRPNGGDEKSLRDAGITTIAALRQRKKAGTLHTIPDIGAAREREILRAFVDYASRRNQRKHLVWLYLSSGALFTLLMIMMGAWGFSKDSFRPHHYYAGPFFRGEVTEATDLRTSEQVPGPFPPRRKTTMQGK
jgi:hypothetical protein